VFVELAEYKDRLSSFNPTGGSAKWQDFNYDDIDTPCAAIYEQPSDRLPFGPAEQDSQPVAALLSEINRIHPFREGNGRAQRQFVRQVAESLGFRLNFQVVSKERMIQASILSANGYVKMMERLVDEITDTEQIQPMTKVIEHFERNNF